MNSLEKTLKNLHTLRLSDEARTRMRAELLSYADLHTAEGPAQAPIVSPWYNAFQGTRLRLYSGLAMVLILLMGVGGTAYASGNTLPGDFLYSVKVSLAEPMQTALIPTEDGKATWHAVLAERRLEEAAQLAARGNLEPEVQNDLADHFAAEVSASLTSADEIQKDGDASMALSVRSDLEARVAAHSQILSVLAAHYDIATTTDSASTAASLKSLIAIVTEHQKSLVSGRLALEGSLSPSADDTQADVSATKLAIEHADGEPAPEAEPVHPKKVAPPVALSARVAEQRSEREEEVSTILSRHAAMLAKFMPLASTTATTTATTTSEVAPERVPETLEKDSK